MTSIYEKLFSLFERRNFMLALVAGQLGVGTAVATTVVNVILKAGT